MARYDWNTFDPSLPMPELQVGDELWINHSLYDVITVLQDTADCALHQPITFRASVPPPTPPSEPTCSE